MDIHRVTGNLPFNQKKHHFTGPYSPLHLQLDLKDNPLLGNQLYNAVDAISMLHDICYRDNDTSAGKCECASGIECTCIQG